MRRRRDKLPLRVVLHEGRGGKVLSGERRFELIRALLDAGYAVESGDAAKAHDGSREVLVLCEPENAGGADISAGVVDFGAGVKVRDVRGADADRVVGIVSEIQRETRACANAGWKPWFPVIDHDRCTNCMQCLSFCLFDVYGVDADSRIEVRNPQKCKTNCPACSRVCPEVAILFPKYGAGPINGDEVQQEDIDREKAKVDISALLGGDIYTMLRERHARATSRFSKERDEKKALKERMRCLRQLKQDLDIPDEVLMSLPGQDEIMAKAREAARASQTQAGESS